MRSTLVVLLVPLLAGCAQSAPPPQALALEQHRFSLESCEQLHLDFLTAAAPFAAYVPRGFSMQTSDAAGATVHLRVEITTCPDGRMIWVEVSLVQDGAAAAPSELATAPVVAYVDPPALASRIAGWSSDLRAQPATIHVAEGVIDATTTSESYHFQVSIRPDTAAFHAITVTRWAASEGRVAGRMTSATSDGLSSGEGAVSLTHTGNGGAPPESLGTAHLVTNMTLDAAWEALR